METNTPQERIRQIITICGGSGSGKTTLAQKFVGAAILATDSFYKDLSDLVPRADGTYDFDDPNSVDLIACNAACQKLANSQDVVIPVYDMRTSRRIGTQLIKAPENRIVAVEGIFAFHSPIVENSTLRIFIDTPVDQRMARRLRRDVERGRSTLDTIRHSLQVEEAYMRTIEPLRHLADLVLMGEEMRGGFLL